MLILSTADAESHPILVNFNGEVNDRVVFTYEAGTSVYGSCSLKINNEFWIFGGKDTAHKNQVSRIQGCSLIRQEKNLPFDFVNGACGTFELTQQFAFLCFSESGNDDPTRTCYRSVSRTIFYQ